MEGQYRKGLVNKVGCYLSLERLDLGGILNGMPGITLGPNHSIKVYLYRPAF